MADNYLERKFEEMEKMKKRHSGYGRYGRYGRMRASSVRTFKPRKAENIKEEPDGNNG